MRDIPEAEARALLARPLVCPEAPYWTPHRQQLGTNSLECGLVDADGTRAGLHVHLLVHKGPKTQLSTFKFSVFQMNFGTAERVYQLHIRQAPRPSSNKHDWPHEHLGDVRRIGDAEWLGWGYAKALERFCSQTNITFLPPVNDPEIFELTS